LIDNRRKHKRQDGIEYQGKKTPAPGAGLFDNTYDSRGARGIEDHEYDDTDRLQWGPVRGTGQGLGQGRTVFGIDLTHGVGRPQGRYDHLLGGYAAHQRDIGAPVKTDQYGDFFKAGPDFAGNRVAQGRFSHGGIDRFESAFEHGRFGGKVFSPAVCFQLRRYITRYRCPGCRASVCKTLFLILGELRKGHQGP